MTNSLKLLVTLFLTTVLSCTVAFSTHGALNTHRSRVSPLHMVFGPKQALAIEKRKDPQAYEATIAGLMKTKQLTRKGAEERYGEFLVDPDGFALNAAAAERKEMGYKNWIDQAVSKSDDPEGTQKRIDDFTARNKLKGTAIMAVFSAVALYYSAMNPYVKPDM